MASFLIGASSGHTPKPKKERAAHAPAFYSPTAKPAAGLLIGASDGEEKKKAVHSNREFQWRYRSTSGAGILSVTEILSLGHIRKLPSGIDPAVIRAAGARGTAVHKNIEQYLRNGTMDYKPEDPCAPYLQSFLAWAELARPEPMEMEVRIDHEVAGLPYAGTTDFFGVIPIFKKCQKWLIDWKSRVVKYGDLHQLVAYKQALVAKGKLDPTCGLAVVEILKTGSRWVEVPSSRLHKNTTEGRAWRLFGAATLIAYHRVEQGDTEDEYAEIDDEEGE